VPFAPTPTLVAHLDKMRAAAGGKRSLGSLVGGGWMSHQEVQQSAPARQKRVGWTDQMTVKRKQTRGRGYLSGASRDMDGLPPWRSTCLDKTTSWILQTLPEAKSRSH